MSNEARARIEMLVRDQIKAGRGVEEILRDWGSTFGPLLEEVIAVVRKDLNAVYTLMDPKAITAIELREEKYRWYPGPGVHSERWFSAKTKLKDSGLAPEDIDSVDDSSTHVVSLLPSPSKGRTSGRGLVLGYVQSGKTTNFISTIAKAADEGYRLIIVLSGTTNPLRRQTQERLEQFLGDTESKSWNWLTTIESDFTQKANAAHDLSHNTIRSIAVIKKNKSRLERLVKWLESAPLAVRENVPFLIVDDEADQASVNSATVIHRQTKINELIKKLLSPELMPHSSYLGYTATPFANILSNAKDVNDLYPRDFLLPLKKAKGYFGAEELFGRDPIDEEDQHVEAGRNVIRRVLAGEVVSLASAASSKAQGGKPLMPDSLRLSIQWFLLATAARRFRLGKVRFSTMLIHASNAVSTHFVMAALVSDRLLEWKRKGFVCIEEELRVLWESERGAAFIDGDFDSPEWTEIRDHCESALMGVEVIVDNYRSTDRLRYDFLNEENCPPYIVVGGNTLSRGLTLEGLCSSYFLRTSNAYDSLLQMGRWFGYRQGYEDLQRIWMQEDLIPFFRDLALVEEEIRRDIDTWADEGTRPDEVAVKIRTHPLLNVTAKNKMLYAITARMGFANGRAETIVFKNDKDWLHGNFLATQAFVTALERSGYRPDPELSRMPVFRNVPWTLIKEYLLDYSWNQSAKKATRDLIIGYVESVQGGYDELDFWTVYFYKLKSSTNEVLIAGEVTISLIERSALYREPDGSVVNIGHLVSAIDGATDLGLAQSEIERQVSGGKINDRSIIELRENRLGGKFGLLGVYLVDKDSKAEVEKDKTKDKTRVDLQLLDHAVGLGFFFPSTENSTSLLNYIGPDLPEMDVDFGDESEVELIEADTEDEAQLLVQN